VIVQTETAVYVLDTPSRMLTRYRREEAPEGWPSASQLRRDGERIPYELHPHMPLTVGEPAVFILQIRDDGVKTVRTTTPVISIDGA
jgi:hypothetical protein